MYPIGSVYISFNNVSPSVLFGGEWESVRGCFLLAENDNYSAGSTGGEETHTLTVDEMPSHTHALDYASYTSAGNTNFATTSSTNAHSSSKIDSTGGSQPHNNMPPYIAVYMWKRIS